MSRASARVSWACRSGATSLAATTPSPTSRACRWATAPSSAAPGPLKRGKGPVRTGVTAILPNEKQHLRAAPDRRRLRARTAPARSRGFTQLIEWGLIETPILLTNTSRSAGERRGPVHGRSTVPGHRRRARRAHPAGGRVRRLLAQRLRGPPRPQEQRLRSPDHGRQRPGPRGLGGRRHGDDVLRLQERHRHQQPQAPRVRGRLHHRHSSDEQLRPPPRPAHGGLPHRAHPRGALQEVRLAPRQPTAPSSPWSPPTRRSSPPGHPLM